MVSSFRHHKLAGARDGVLTALVGVRRRNAFAFETAIRSLAGRLTASKAVKRSDKQNDCHQADRNVNAAAHPVSG
jgi:hypothetical protein